MGTGGDEDIALWGQLAMRTELCEDGWEGDKALWGRLGMTELCGDRWEWERSFAGMGGYGHAPMQLSSVAFVCLSVCLSHRTTQKVVNNVFRCLEGVMCDLTQINH